MAEESKLTTPDQLDAMSQSHRAHGDVAHATAEHLQAGHGTVQGCDGWGGSGYDEINQVFQHMVVHMHHFGDVKHMMASAVNESKDAYVATEAGNARNMTAE